MVQFKKQFAYGVPDSIRSSTYWMLGSYIKITGAEAKRILHKRGFYCKKTEQVIKTIELLSRAERGHLSYAGYLVSELTVFVRDRGIEIGFDKPSKGYLISTLERADDEATFTRFMELPAELRNRIYALHLETLDLPPLAHQPPICLVSRQIRNESIPLFYSTSAFDLSIRSYHGGTPCDQSDLYSLCASSRLFWSRIPAIDLTRITALIITVHLIDTMPYVDHWTTQVAVKINLKTRQGNPDETHRVKLEQKGGFTLPGINHIRQMQCQLDAVVVEIIGRPGVQKLQRHDIQKLAAACTLYEN